MGKNYYIFRISYGHDKESILSSLKIEGVLRQGWGSSGMSLEDGVDSFENGWRKAWSDDLTTTKDIGKRYDILSLMLNFVPGDIIVIPKVPENNQFSILEVIEGYYFDVTDSFTNRWNMDDFRHCIKVKVLKEGVNYIGNGDEVNQIQRTFRAYQSAVNNVWNEKTINAIESVIKSFEINGNSSLLEDIGIGNSKNFSELSKEIINRVTHWAPHTMENIIREIFEKNGYILLGKNNYNREGGDIDLTFGIDYGNLLDDIMTLSDNNWNKEEIIPKIYIQVKNKKGKDSNVIEGINQLIKMKEDNKNENAILILINTTNKIDDNDIRLADEANIILIYGDKLSQFLMKYSIII